MAPPWALGRTALLALSGLFALLALSALFGRGGAAATSTARVWDAALRDASSAPCHSTRAERLRLRAHDPSAYARGMREACQAAPCCARLMAPSSRCPPRPALRPDRRCETSA